MRTKQTITKLLALAYVAVVIISHLALFSHAQAQNVSTDVNLDWVDGASSCYGTANGQTVAYYGAVSGDSITLHLNNVSATEVITVDVSETGQTTYSHAILPGTSVSPVFPVNSEISVLANGVTCTSGHGGPGAFYVEAAAGSMTCSIANNQVWTVSINYSGIINTASLYRDGTFVDSFTNFKNNSLNVPVQFAAMSTAATYYLYYGSNNSSRLLNQATCPAKSTAAPSSSTTPKPSTTATPTTPTTPASDTTTSAKPQTNTTVTKPQSASMNVNNKKTSHKIPLWLWPLVAVVVASLGFGLWKFYPKIRQLSWFSKLRH